MNKPIRKKLASAEELAEYYRQYSRWYYHHCYKKNIRLRTEPDKMLTPSERGRNWRKKYPERAKAHRAVYVAKRNGTLIPTPCKRCRNKKVEAHHEDYKKPLEVIWLCKKCHVMADQKRQMSESVAINKGITVHS